tara:strand:- start:523 stop:2394 length:1872 start_codon:yes stop_codon:yes gene_type:complete
VALASVKLELLTGQAERSAKRLQSRTKELSNRFEKVKNRSNAAGNKIQKFGRQSATASKGVNKLGRAIRGLFIGLSVIQGLRFTFMKTAELETQRKSLEVLTGSLEKTNQIIRELQDFGAVTPFTSSDLIESGKRLKAFGVETEEIVAVTKRLADVAGTVGQPLGEIVAAYGKIQARGKLTLETLEPLQIRGINITDELSKMTGLYGDELTKAMSKGKIGAGLVEQAFKNLTSESGLYFEGAIKQSETLNGKWSTLVDNVEALARNLGKFLSPVFKWIIDQLNEILSTFNKVFKLLSDAQIGASNRNVGSAAFKSRLGMQSDAVADITKAVSLLDTSWVKSEQDAQKLLEQLQRISDVIELVRGPDSAKVLEGRGLLDPLLESSNQIDTMVEKIRKLQLTFKGDGKPIITPETVGIPTVLDGIDKVGVKWEQIRETIASGLTSAIEGLISGTKSLGESLAGIAKQIASMYLKSAILSFLPGLPAATPTVTKAEGGHMANGIKPFASGGMATKPTLGLIGEAGEDEYVIPASKMAASMQRYSAGARGEAVIPGTGSSYAGGGAGSSTTVNYSGPILNFNSEEFVPKSAIGQIINSAAARGASAGEARTLSSLRNSRSRRSSLGL